MWLFCLLFKHKEFIFEVFSVLKPFECFCICRFFQIWVRLWKTYQKTLRRLLGKFSNVFYARRLPAKSFEVLCLRWYKGMMSSGVQAYLSLWIISSSMCYSFVYCLFYDLFVFCFSCDLFFKLIIKRIWYICSCFFQSNWHYWSYWYNIPRNFLNHSTHS